MYVDQVQFGMVLAVRLLEDTINVTQDLIGLVQIAQECKSRFKQLVQVANIGMEVVAKICRE